MAKSTKPKVAETKKEKEVKPELPKVETIETITGDIDTLVSESKLPEPVIGDTPPSVTFDEVEQVKEEPVVKPLKQVGSHIDIDTGKTTPLSNQTEELPMDQRILNYLEDKSGEVRLNDFLKSLFPLPKNGEPPVWLQQGSSRLLRSVLEAMPLNIVDNKHRLLGQGYYPDTTTGKLQHHNLNTVVITAKK